ncbi:unnamed protein product, partial [Phaeothamnion confervicola]
LLFHTERLVLLGTYLGAKEHHFISGSRLCALSNLPVIATSLYISAASPGTFGRFRSTVTCTASDNLFSAAATLPYLGRKLNICPAASVRFAFSLMSAERTASAGLVCDAPMYDDSWHCCSPIGRNTLICGRKRSRISCIVGPDVCGMVATLTFISGITLLFLVFITGREHAIATALASTTYVLLLCAYLLTACGDPGIIYQQAPGEPPHDGWDAQCGRCDVRRPRGAQHCNICAVCVEGSDHHCVWSSKVRLLPTPHSVFSSNVFESRAFRQFRVRRLFLCSYNDLVGSWALRGTQLPPQSLLFSALPYTCAPTEVRQNQDEHDPQFSALGAVHARPTCPSPFAKYQCIGKKNILTFYMFL